MIGPFLLPPFLLAGLLSGRALRLALRLALATLLTLAVLLTMLDGMGLARAAHASGASGGAGDVGEAGADSATRWQIFKERFISGDGRVIDWQNRHMSHSEGQGYAMLLAVKMDDPTMFARLLAWSDNNLGKGLRAWSWGHSQEGWRVLDRNNATDGDMFHAWALLLAGQKWSNPAYTREGLDIVKAIRLELVDGHGFLLPARWGFQQDGETRLNLSYYVFPALRAFAEADPAHAGFWNKVYARGLSLYRESLANPAGLSPDWLTVNAVGHLLPPEGSNAAYGESLAIQAGLPPDWLTVNADGHLLPPEGSDAAYGFEAIRIPLMLAAAQEKAALAPLRPFIARAARDGWTPERVSLLHPATVPSPHGSPSPPDDSPEGGIGHYATLARAAQALGMRHEAVRLWQLADKSRETNPRNYYGEALYLLARVL